MQNDSKTEKDLAVVKAGLLAFYRKVEETQNPAFLKAIKTFKNRQVEILNSYIFGYSNGFLEGINNTSKVIKRMPMALESTNISRRTFYLVEYISI